MIRRISDAGELAGLPLMPPDVRLDGRDVALASDAATLLFTGVGPGLFAIHLAKRGRAKGADTKATILDSLAWMFSHTDALVIQAVVAADNAASRVMAAGVPGVRAAADGGGDGGERTYALTLAQWAKARGVRPSIDDLRAAGRADKADKLEAAARAAGLLP